MYEFHYDYSKNKYCSKPRLLFTHSDSYPFKTEDVYADFSKDKKCLILVIIPYIKILC